MGEATTREAWRCTCGARETRVLDSRPMPYGQYRRRQCVFCHRRFSTMERYDEDGAVVGLDDLNEFERAFRASNKLRSALSKITNRLKGLRQRARIAEATRTRELESASEGRNDDALGGGEIG